MPVKTYVNDSGTWRDIRNIHVNDGGTWRNLRSAWVNDGSAWRLVFQSVFSYTKTFSVDTPDYNLYNDLISNGWNGNQSVDVTLIVNSGIRVYATTVGNYGMTISGLPSTSTITLTNNGTITGKGGNGGAGGATGIFTNINQLGPALTNVGLPGSVGGPAMFIRNNITIINNGVIGSGGGGGGGAGSAIGYSATTYCFAGPGGGGGAGSSNSTSSGGAGGITGTNFSTDFDGTAGSAGGNSAGAGGPRNPVVGAPVLTSAYSGPGGSGGARGNSGAAGGIGSSVTINAGSWTESGGAGAAAGVAINGNSYATFSTLGTVSGPRIN